MVFLMIQIVLTQAHHIYVTIGYYFEDQDVPFVVLIDSLVDLLLLIDDFRIYVWMILGHRLNQQSTHSLIVFHFLTLSPASQKLHQLILLVFDLFLQVNPLYMISSHYVLILIY